MTSIMRGECVASRFIVRSPRVVAAPKAMRRTESMRALRDAGQSSRDESTERWDEWPPVGWRLSRAASLRSEPLPPLEQRDEPRA